jgi:hypothetical protein
MAMKSTTANKFWTPEDDERLKSLIENSTSLNCVAAKLQRSVSAVKNRAYALKISIARTVQGEEMMGRRPWTIQDDDQLRVLAATGETSGSIAVRLDVEPQQVVLSQTEAADWRLRFYPAMRPMPVVSMKPVGEFLGAAV